MENETALDTLRRALDRCVADRAPARRSGCKEATRLSLEVHRLADAGGTPNHSPAVLREAAVAVMKVAEMVRLCDARDYTELTRKPHFEEALTRAKFAVAA